MQYLRNLQSQLSESLWIRSHREPKSRDFRSTSSSTLVTTLRTPSQVADDNAITPFPLSEATISQRVDDSQRESKSGSSPFHLVQSSNFFQAEQDLPQVVEPVILSLTPLTRFQSKRSHHQLGITTTLFQPPSIPAAQPVTLTEFHLAQGDDNGLQLRRGGETHKVCLRKSSVVVVDDPLLQLLGQERPSIVNVELPPEERDSRRRKEGSSLTSGTSSSSTPAALSLLRSEESKSRRKHKQLSFLEIDTSPAGERRRAADKDQHHRPSRDRRLGEDEQGKVSVEKRRSSDEKLLRYYIHETFAFPAKGGPHSHSLEQVSRAPSSTRSSRTPTFSRGRPSSSSSSLSSSSSDTFSLSEGDSLSDSEVVVGSASSPVVHHPSSSISNLSITSTLPHPAQSPHQQQQPSTSGASEGRSCSHKILQRKKSLNSDYSNGGGASDTIISSRHPSLVEFVLQFWTKRFNLGEFTPKKFLSIFRRRKKKRVKGGVVLSSSSNSTSTPPSSHSHLNNSKSNNSKRANLKFNQISRRKRRRTVSKAQLRLWAKMDHEDLVRELPQIEKLSNQERLRLAHKRRMLQLKKFQQYEKELNSNSKKHRGDSDLMRRNLPGKHKHIHPHPGRNGSRRIRFRNSIMLLEAAGRNDVEEVRLLLESGVNPDVANEDGLTALHQCCIDDNEEMMKQLLDYGANVNSEDSEKWTPLHAASTCGHLHLVQYLIAKGANLLAVNAEGNMPYDICDDETTLDYIESEMAKRGVTQELIEEIRALPETRMLQDVQRIHAQGGDLECRDVDGATPLHIASANGYYRAAEFLLDNHTATDVQDKDCWQPIHAAACWGHLDVLELLVHNGADLDARTKNNETPYAICEDPEIKERIIQLRTEQQSKRQNEGRKRPSRTHSTNSRTQSIRRTSQRDKGLTSKRDAADEAQMLRAREELNKENSPSPTSDISVSNSGGGTTTAATTTTTPSANTVTNGTSNGVAHHQNLPPDGHNHENGNSSEEDPDDKTRPFPGVLGRDSIGNVKIQSDEQNRLRKIAVGSGANHNHHQLNNQSHHNNSSSGNANNAIKMNNLYNDNNGSLLKNTSNIQKNLNSVGGSGGGGGAGSPVSVGPVPDDNGNMLPKPEINPPVDNKVSLGGGGSSGVSLSGSRDNLVGLSSSAGNSTIDIHVSVTINTNSPVSTLTNGGGSHGPSSILPLSPGSTIFTPPGTLSDLKKQRSLIRTSSNPLTNGGMNDSTTVMTNKYQPPASPTLTLRKYVGDPVQPVGDYGDGGKRCCVIM